MEIIVLTVCPELFQSFLHSHVVLRAKKLSAAEIKIVDIRSFAKGSFRQVDDSPYGGGHGMILRCKPILDALSSIQREGKESIASVLTPAGRRYHQSDAKRYAKCDQLILICGHYEGIDERVMGHCDELISVGDYVLTGGELPAMLVADSVLRLLKGVLKEGGTAEESFEENLLEYPQYTQPAEVYGERVPDVLLSGNHEKIRAYRKAEAERITGERRPDLMERYTRLTKSSAVL